MKNVILYYHFARIENLPEFCADHRRKCEALNLLGRVYVAQEGINGTLSGSPEKISEYKEFLWSLPGFESAAFKEGSHEEDPFIKLIVKMRRELATLKSPIELDITKERGKYLEPQEWKAMFDSNKDFVVIDVRNNYESKIGHFQGAIKPDLKNFYDFPQWLEKVEKEIPKKKKVLMYCTGGIRCEKFSVLMEKKGWQDVNQLHGGIIRYAQETGGAHYKGKCFVFDDRLAVQVEKDQKEPLSVCEITGAPCDQYLNCADPDCNRLFLCSVEGAHKYEGCCSSECYSSKRRRPFDPKNIYEPTRKWYNYFSKEIKQESYPKKGRI